MAERDSIGVGCFIEPLAALDDFGAEIAKMRDWPAEVCDPEPKEDRKHFQKERCPLDGIVLLCVPIRTSSLWWRQRGKLRDVGNAERLFDASDLRHGVFKSILAELLMLDCLEQLAHFVELMR